jgi:hypothetical protein
MDPKNSELADWTASLGIHLADVQKDDEIVPVIARQYCIEMGLDPDQMVTITLAPSGGIQEVTLSSRYEAMVQSTLRMLRVIYRTLREGAK